MAITILNTPQTFMPVYNPIMLIVSGSTHTKPGFQYIFNLYEFDGVDTILIDVDKRPAAPIQNNNYSLSGLGIIDFSEFLKSRVTYDFDPNLTGTSKASGSVVTYRYTIQEEYINEWNFFSAFTSGNTVGTAGTYVSFSSRTSQHGYSVGDIISVTMYSSGNTYQNYNGIHQVNFVYNNFAFQIDAQYGGSTASPEGGTTIYADRRKTITSPTTISSNRFAYNGSINFKDWPLYTGSTYLLENSNEGKWLTSMPLNGWELRENSTAFYQFANKNMNTPFGIRIVSKGENLISGYTTTGGIHNSGTASFIIDTGGYFIPSNTQFFYSVDDGSGIGMSNSGIGVITGYSSGYYQTTVNSSLNAGTIWNGYIQIKPGVLITGAVNNSGTAQFYLYDIDYYLQPGSPFSYTVDDGSPIGIANSGTGIVIGRTGNTIDTTVVASIFAGGLISGVCYYSSTTIGEVIQSVVTITGDTYYTGPGLTNVTQIGLGPWNLNNTIPSYYGFASNNKIIKDNTKKYEFTLLGDFQGDLQIASKTYSINIDRRCSYYNRDEIEIIFKDSLNSWQSFTFQLKNEKNTKIIRNEYRKQLGTYYGQSSGWSYNTYDRGRTLFNVDYQDSYEATSDWITSDSNIEYLAELFYSPEAYWVFDRNNNVILPIIITSSDYKTKKIINDRLVNATITFEIASNNNVNI